MYLIYCFACCVFVATLMVMTIQKGFQYLANPQTPAQWVFPARDEIIEVVFGICLLTEMALTLLVRGLMTCAAKVRRDMDHHSIPMHGIGYLLDFCVVALSVPSIVFGVHQLHCKLCETEPRWLLVRVVLQPLRVCTILRGTWRTYKMQYRGSDPVDFGRVSRCGLDNDIELSARRMPSIIES